MADGKERKMESWLWRPWPWRRCKLCTDFVLRSRHHGSCGCEFALWPRHSRPGNLLLQFSYTEILADIHVQRSVHVTRRGQCAARFLGSQFLLQICTPLQTMLRYQLTYLPYPKLEKECASGDQSFGSSSNMV